ncbi:MAG: peptidoglycan DD-metalloendopeptidase family protein [Proteobacteria bacterium]|nr:peptidase M23 [Pseudomonadota bacterium]NOG61744.1 peptidoglycan DD-metalloendopeptidase family protein [Pseudomonadota bacterium]
MTYRVYIKKDYKSKVERIGVNTTRPYFIKIAALAAVVISTYFIFGTDSTEIPESTPTPAVSSAIPEIKALETPTFEISQDSNIIAEEAEPENIALGYATELETYIVEEVLDDSLYDYNPVIVSEETVQTTDEIIDPWQSVTVKPGDSLALMFSRLGLSPSSLYKLMSLGKEVSNLKKIRPGEILHFHIKDDELIGLKYEINLTNTLKITNNDNQFSSEVIKVELEKVVKNSSAIINDSLFLSGKKAGLSDNLIMQLVAVYGWDIDFALDIREGDSFTVIYEEQYKDGVKVSDGPIIAAEFVNRNTPLRAVRYEHENGRTDYYADNGDAMRKAFLRTPVELARISSRFNLRRKHPILNKIRAHKGVDYAASTGTPIKATGDGTVIHAGKKGGYGRTIILKHGGTYSTLYAHLHRYANGVRTGSRVRQGQVIGYVGKSGLATGPHLHYEFRINGVHRNPLTVKLPKVESIPEKALPEFKLAINPMIIELDKLTGKSAVAIQQQETPIKLADAMMEDG